MSTEEYPAPSVDVYEDETELQTPESIRRVELTAADWIRAAEDTGAWRRSQQVAALIRHRGRSYDRTWIRAVFEELAATIERGESV